MDSTKNLLDLNSKYVDGYNEDVFPLMILDNEDSTTEDVGDLDETNRDDVVDGGFENADDVVDGGFENAAGDQEIEADIDSENVTEPCEEMTFDSAEMLLQFLHDYGKSKGFQVRIRSSSKKKEANKETGETETNCFKDEYADYIRMRIVCSKEGECQTTSKNPSRSVSSSRCGCPFTVNACVCGDGTSWRITTIHLEHNHECNPENSMFMPSYRHISGGNRIILLDNDRAGVPVAKNFSSFVARYGGHNKVPFSERDCRNAITLDRRLKLRKGDFAAMRDYFETMMTNSSNFFYSFDTTDDGVLKNVFWADGRARAAYKDFGDIISFDATYVKNRYRMPFAPFIGVNHHGQSIVLGGSLLRSEDTENYMWLFRTWLKCMHNKSPKGIITDQCKAMENAILEVFPNTTHRWCLWHVMKNAKKHLEKIKDAGGFDQISSGLHKVLHFSYTVNEFEIKWVEWVSEFGLERSNWCKTMFANRTKWVPIYFKNDFWAGMSTTQRSEGMNYFFKGFVNGNTSLQEFVKQYGMAMGKRAMDEDKASFDSINKPLHCSTKHEFEHVFQKAYTTKKFKEFQDEVRKLTYAMKENMELVGKIKVYDIMVRWWASEVAKRRTFKVSYDPDTCDVKCDCKKFEFTGIMCCHTLVVFIVEEVRLVPEKYIMDRWRKDLPREHIKIPVPYYSLDSMKPQEMSRYESMKSDFEAIATLSMTNDEMFYVVKGALEDLKGKVQGISKRLELPYQSLRNIGRVYGKRRSLDAHRVMEPGSSVDVNDDVRDPIDKRGKGRLAARRKGYLNDTPGYWKRGKGSQLQQGIPYHPGLQAPAPQVSNAFHLPPFQVIHQGSNVAPAAFYYTFGHQ